MRVLDLGCGKGNPPIKAQLGVDDWVVGIDKDLESLATARQQYPGRPFLCCRAESLPFRDGSFERVVSAVAVPYTNIPQVLAEAKRALVPGGRLFLSAHNLGFTLSELRQAMPKPKAVLYRLYVLANGLIFHLTGKWLSWPTEEWNRFKLFAASSLPCGGQASLTYRSTVPTADLSLKRAPRSSIFGRGRPACFSGGTGAAIPSLCADGCWECACLPGTLQPYGA